MILDPPYQPSAAPVVYGLRRAHLRRVTDAAAHADIPTHHDANSANAEAKLPARRQLGAAELSTGIVDAEPPRRPARRTL